MKAHLAALLMLLAAPPWLFAPVAQEPSESIVRIAHGYQVTPNLVYRTASGWEATLDVYQPRGVNAPTPVLLFFHGGGWTGGAKEHGNLALLPYLELGWAVVNANYRLAKIALAPAAVEDARCALRWVYRHAAEYRFDVGRVVTSGQSAGGHLALSSGMLPDDTPFDHACPGDRDGGSSSAGPRNTQPLRVAAIVDWYGISNVSELLAGVHRKSYAVAWLGALPAREALAAQVSPETHVRSGGPPIISVHGDADPTVPYSQKQRFHAALERVGAAHDLVTIREGKHGGFAQADTVQAYARIRSFLARHVSTPIGPSNSK
jgi:acetyl esterase/lipase